MMLQSLKVHKEVYHGVLLLCFWFLTVESRECSYAPNPVLVIIDVQPTELGLPTKAYYAIEEVNEVNQHQLLLIAFGL